MQANRLGFAACKAGRFAYMPRAFDPECRGTGGSRSSWSAVSRNEADAPNPGPLIPLRFEDEHDDDLVAASPHRFLRASFSLFPPKLVNRNSAPMLGSLLRPSGFRDLCVLLCGSPFRAMVG